MELKKAISEANEFIFSCRDKSGLWKDFRTKTHGESVDWVSSYAGLALLKSGISQSELEITANSVSQRQGRYGGWGYNLAIVPDVDSTAYTIMFLSNFGYEKKIQKAREFLLKHQNPNGSFSTYLPNLIRKYHRITYLTSVKGWCSGIPEVTATALQALENNNEAIRFLKQSQQENGSWRTYWGTNDIYSTAQVISAIKNHNLDDEILKAQAWLAQQNTPNPFYTAFQIKGLTNTEHRIEDQVQELLNSQKDDGSWKSLPFLRFPHPSDKEPGLNNKRWRPDITDQNRIFTTATCLQALTEYKNGRLSK